MALPLLSRTAAAAFRGAARPHHILARSLPKETLLPPLLTATLIDGGDEKKEPIAVNCEVVLFDHLLWMLDNAADLCDATGGKDDGAAMKELAQLYAC